MDFQGRSDSILLSPRPDALMEQTASLFSSLLTFQTGHRDEQSSKNFHVHTKRQIFKFIQKGRVSHLPGGCFWATAMGITERVATFQ